MNTQRNTATVLQYNGNITDALVNREQEQFVSPVHLRIGTFEYRTVHTVILQAHNVNVRYITFCVLNRSLIVVLIRQLWPYIWQTVLIKNTVVIDGDWEGEGHGRQVDEEEEGD